MTEHSSPYHYCLRCGRRVIGVNEYEMCHLCGRWTKAVAQSKQVAEETRIAIRQLEDALEILDIAIQGFNTYDYEYKQAQAIRLAKQEGDDND